MSESARRKSDAPGRRAGAPRGAGSERPARLRPATKNQLLRRVVPIFVNLPYEQLSLQGVAAASGASLWAFRRRFSNVECLFRAVAACLIDEVAAACEFEPRRGRSVMEAISEYAGFVADLVESEAYRSLLHFVLRNGRHHPWLERAYDQRVVRRLCETLDAAIMSAGDAHGLTIRIAPGAARRLHKRLEMELLLNSIFPSAESPQIDRAELVRSVGREAFASTYVFDWKVPKSDPGWNSAGPVGRGVHPPHEAANARRTGPSCLASAPRLP